MMRQGKEWQKTLVGWLGCLFLAGCLVGLVGFVGLLVGCLVCYGLLSDMQVGWLVDWLVCDMTWWIRSIILNLGHA